MGSTSLSRRETNRRKKTAKRNVTLARASKISVPNAAEISAEIKARMEATLAKKKPELLEQAGQLDDVPAAVEIEIAPEEEVQQEETVTE